MKKIKEARGFTLIEVIVSTAVFVIFAIGLYSAVVSILKAVYKSRIAILETALLDEQLEIARNLTYDNIGLLGGIPVGVIPHTTTTVRNGVQFEITTAIRSIDDPFDGTMNGTPVDFAPADYKLVEMTAKCLTCFYSSEKTISTMIPPRDLEGSSNNGAIFVHVTDSRNNPVQGANVRVVNTNFIPNIDIQDITDKNGELKIIDVPTGTFSYDITVSKSGTNIDQTVASSTENPNPTKKPVTVLAQTISDSYFSIDQLGSMSIHTMDESCEAIPDVPFHLNSKKLIGENLPKFSRDLQTDGSGLLDLTNLEFDDYFFNFSGSYDLAGSLPISPTLAAGSNKNVSLVLSPHTSNSLLLSVLDNANDLPLSNASVELKRAGFNSTKVTDYGNLSQTDWSGPVGETNFTSENPGAYYSSANVDFSPGNIELSKFNGAYLNGGVLESSIFDLGKKMDLLNVTFASDMWPPEAGPDSILLQLAVSNSSTLDALNSFVGPDGTSQSFYTTTSTVVYTGGQKYRYFRYKVYIYSSPDQLYAPNFSDFGLTFTNGCIPPGQVFFPSLASSTYSLRVSATGYDTVSTTVDVDGRTSTTIKLYKSI